MSNNNNSPFDPLTPPPTTDSLDWFEQEINTTASLPLERDEVISFCHYDLRYLVEARLHELRDLEADISAEQAMQQLWLARHTGSGHSFEWMAKELQIQFEFAEVGDTPAVLLTFPLASATLECHYIAIVPHNSECCYFTLECSKGLPPNHAMACAWREDDSHVNFGELEINKASFLKRIQEVL